MFDLLIQTFAFRSIPGSRRPARNIHRRAAEHRTQPQDFGCAAYRIDVLAAGFAESSDTATDQLDSG